MLLVYELIDAPQLFGGLYTPRRYDRYVIKQLKLPLMVTR